MSVLSNKSILFIGEVTNDVKNIEDSLVKHGMTVQFIDQTHQNVDIKPDLIIINHIDDDKDYTDILKQVQKPTDHDFSPVFILIKNSNLETQVALKYNAFDYFSLDEGIDSILQKISNIYQSDDTFSVNSVIDITPAEIRLTTTGVKVYVIEDDPLLRNLLNTRLQKSSFPHEFSTSAEGAILAMKQFVPDVIILDLMLPGKDGFQLLAEIKEEDELKNVPVVVFSNRDSQADRKRTQELGASAFRVKAMTDLSELIELIQTLAKQ